jgi:hypothetical protein
MSPSAATAARARSSAMRGIPAHPGRDHDQRHDLHVHGRRRREAHEAVRHSTGEYVRGEVHTNSVEEYFSIFKPGMKGIYQHCSEKHLHGYLAEFDFRYNNRVALGVNDLARADNALKGIVGKRLTYLATGS